MAKAPAFQFYPQDWLSDANVKRLSWAAKGVYAELLALMWNEQEDRLPDNEDVPKILGITEAEWRAFRDEFQNKPNKKQRVFAESKGYLVSRRLKKERRKQRHTRRVRQEAARCKWKAFADAKRCSSSSVSSSASASSSPVEKEKKQPSSPGGDGYSPGFTKWWKAYPKGERKRGKPNCWKKWKREKLDTRTEDILACVAAAKQSKNWKRDGGQYIPGPHPWLNSAPWLTEDFAKHAADGPVPGFTPKMGSATADELRDRAWTYELTAAQRQEWFARAEKEMPGQPKPLIWGKAKNLWDQDRLPAGKE